MKKQIHIAALCALALVPAGCAIMARDAQVREPDAELLHLAVHQLSSVIVYDIFSPPQASRVYAYASVAAYEVLRQEHPQYASLAGQVNGLSAIPAPDAKAEISYPLAGVHAFMSVGRMMTFSRPRMDSLRSAMDARIRSGGMSEEVYARSIAYGDTVAARVLAWAAEDHFVQTRGYPKYTVVAKPGLWVPTPPAYMDAVEPNWPALRPFVMDSASQFKPPPPTPFDTAKNSAFYRDAKEVMDAVKNLTTEQRAIASFWDCNPYVMHVQGHAMFATKKITPGGHWMGIVTIAAQKADASMLQSAEAYARTSIALADAFISAWDEKYRSRLVRPETAINSMLDESWEPLLQTPPFPEYPSGHSVVSNAAATVLSSQFGAGFAFVDSSEVEYGLPARSFTSFEAAAAEAAISRLYGGIHYRPAIEHGAVQGKAVGEFVNARVRTSPQSVAARRAVAPASAPAATGGRH